METFAGLRSDVMIRVENEPDLRFWAYVLETSPEALRQAVDLVGPEVLGVVQYLRFRDRCGLPSTTP